MPAEALCLVSVVDDDVVAVAVPWRTRRQFGVLMMRGDIHAKCLAQLYYIYIVDEHGEESLNVLLRLGSVNNLLISRFGCVCAFCAVCAHPNALTPVGS